MSVKSPSKGMKEHHLGLYFLSIGIAYNKVKISKIASQSIELIEMADSG